MRIPNQKKVWNEIAPEWHKFKTQINEKKSPETLKFLEKQKGKILDLGCGSGRYLAKIKNGEMYLVDFSKEMIRLAEKHAKKLKISAKFSVSEMTNLPFPTNFFDAAIADSSFHCLNPKEQKKAVKELYRVLKPGAQAGISVWNMNSRRFKNSPKEKLINWREKGKRYYYLFDEKEIHDLFKKYGFKIKKQENPGVMIRFIAEKPI